MDVRKSDNNSSLLAIKMPTSVFRFTLLAVGALVSAYCIAFIANAILLGIPVYLSLNPPAHVKFWYFIGLGKSSAPYGLAGGIAALLLITLQQRFSRTPGSLNGRIVLLALALSPVFSVLTGCILGIVQFHLTQSKLLFFLPGFLKTYGLSGFWGGSAVIAVIVAISSRRLEPDDQSVLTECKKNITLCVPMSSQDQDRAEAIEYEIAEALMIAGTGHINIADKPAGKMTLVISGPDAELLQDTVKPILQSHNLFDETFEKLPVNDSQKE